MIKIIANASLVALVAIIFFHEKIFLIYDGVALKIGGMIIGWLAVSFIVGNALGTFLNKKPPKNKLS